MPFQKYATADILDAQMAVPGQGLMKNAHRAVFTYTPKPGYLYVRSRAISSRCNDNFDMFPAPEIEKAYMTFIGKPVFVNHHNEDHRRARGVIIDAALHRDKNPDGSPDTWVELLHEVDAVKFPKLAKAILAKEVNRTSMGCDVQFSKCSVCDNVATSPLEYCQHIPGKKGKRIVSMGKRGEREAKLVFEVCSGLSFFENSLLVEQPADPTAYFLGEVEYGPGLEAMAASVQKTAAFHPASPTGLNEARHVEETNDTDGYDSGFRSDKGGIHVHDYPRAINELQANWNIHDDNMADDYNPDKRRDSTRRREVGKLIDSLKTHHQKESSWTGNNSNSIWNLIKQAAKEEETVLITTTGSNDRVWDLIRTAAATGDDLDDEYFTHTAAEEEAPDPSHFTMALHSDPKMQTALKKHEEATGVSHEQGVQNIMSHFLSAHSMAQKGPEEGSHLYHRGMNWYKEFHNTARMITGGRMKQGQKDVEGGDPHLGAGLLAAYSPKTNVGTNQRLAAEAYRLGRGIGGGSGLPDKSGNSKPRDPHNTPGFPAMRSHADKANRLLGVRHDDDNPGTWKKTEPEHWSTVIPNASSVKTHNFTSNIAHGGQNHEEVNHLAKQGIDGRRVTVDDQALSIYLGRSATEKEHSDLTSGGALKGHPDAFRNNHIVASAYREANNRLVQHGHNVSPEQTQAVTWEHYRAAHPEENDGSPEALKIQKGKETAAKVTQSSFKKWRGYVAEHFKEHEDESHSKIGVRKVAYGETKAPQDVDTLRAENCTVCGNSTAFDGVQCQICGYTAPPRPFGDPDTDAAKANDVHKEVLDTADGTADPADPSQQLGNQIGNPEELEDQASDAQAAGQIPALTCNNCATGIQPAPPVSEGGEPPYPADGDVCPVCKSGELTADSSGEAGEDMDGDGIPDEDEAPTTDEDPKNDKDPDDDEDDDDNPFPKKKDKAK